jgi:hypothetical protein
MRSRDFVTRAKEFPMLLDLFRRLVNACRAPRTRARSLQDSSQLANIKVPSPGPGPGPRVSDPPPDEAPTDAAKAAAPLA